MTSPRSEEHDTSPQPNLVPSDCVMVAELEQAQGVVTVGFQGAAGVALSRNNDTKFAPTTASHCLRSKYTQFRTSARGEITSSIVDPPMAAFGIKRRRSDRP